MSATEAQGNSTVIIRENSIDYSTKKKNVKEARRLRRWLTREDPVVIMTHMNVDADAAFSPIESVSLKYKNTESDIVTPATSNLGVLSFVRLSSFLIPVSDALFRSMVTPVTSGAV